MGAARTLDPDTRDRLAALAPRATTRSMATERTLAVHSALDDLLPQGLVRGTTMTVEGHSAQSVAALLAAGASQAGAWVGVTGLPDLGLQAWQEAGVALDRVVLVRVVLVRTPASAVADPATVLATLIDGFDIVVAGSAMGARLRTGAVRALKARLRTRGAVLIVVGGAGSFAGDVRITSSARWQGLGRGDGYLRTRLLDVTVEGRGIPAVRRGAVWFPDATGSISPVDRAVAESSRRTG